MSNATIPMDLRRVLDAPRGHRFSRTPNRPGTRPAVGQVIEAVPEPLPPLVSLGRTPRERELLAQMPDTPRLRHRFTHGDLPEWMRVAAARRASEPSEPPESCWRQNHEPKRTPRPTPARKLGEEAEPARPLPIPRPRREQAPRPPLPRRSDLPRRPASHRKPRRRIGHLITGYALAAIAGAMGQHLVAFLS